MLALGVGIVEFVAIRSISDAAPSSNWAAPGKTSSELRRERSVMRPVF
jgi:hypothetical protein